MPEEFVYEQLSFKIIGVVYDVYNNLGPGLKEKTYKDAMKVGLKKLNIPIKRELYAPIYYEKILVGKRFYDFFIDEQVILELKIGNYYSRQHMEQVNDYLHSANLKLAILAYFGSDRVRIKRIVNLK